LWKNGIWAATALCRWISATAVLRLSRFEVRGPSMSPALKDGDRVLVLRGVYRVIRPRSGQIVLAQLNGLRGREVVKRVGGAGPREPDSYLLLGDNPALSTDSRHFGAVPRARITGRVLLRYWPNGRRGRIR
jgi:signal peptidase I